MIKLHLYIVILATILLLCTAKSSFAQSSYVLPYPSFMPGSKFYQLQLLKDALLKYWYFGNFGQFRYNLKQSDKYLVEAKTLFEYKQYLLGYQALEKSNEHFVKLKPILANARNEGKNITEKEKTLHVGGLKHIEVLVALESSFPETYFWQPEKSLPTNLHLKSIIEKSIEIRKGVL